MTFNDILKETNSRLSLGYSWLVLNGKTYSVYNKEYGAKKTKLLVETEDITKALHTLFESER